MKKRTRPGWTWTRHLVQGAAITLAAVALFFVLTYPQWRRRGGDHDYRNAINNLRQIGLAMFEFETEYEALPNRETIPMLEAVGSGLSLSGDSSNDYFSQLLASNIASSESMFYAKSKSSIRPDDVFGEDKNTLLPGNTSFAYIAGLSFEMNGETPLVFGPVIPCTSILDQEVYDGKAVVLHLDCSVKTLSIDSHGNIRLESGKILDLKRSTFDGNPVDIKWPK